MSKKFFEILNVVTYALIFSIALSFAIAVIIHQETIKQLDKRITKLEQVR